MIVKTYVIQVLDEYITRWRDSHNHFPCGVSAELISVDQAHVDHTPLMTFEKIVVDFLALKRLNFDQVPLSERSDNQVHPGITDESLKIDFCAYHERVADLRIIKKAINLAQSSRFRLGYVNKHPMS